MRPLLKAVKEDPGYLAFSDYATQLEPYFERFGRGAVLTLTFEALIEDPQREVDRIYRWLGLPSHPIGDKSGKAHNQKPNDVTAVAGAGILNRIQYSTAWDRISPHVPAWIKNLAKKQAYRPVAEQEVERDIPRLREAIAELQRRQIDRLTRLLGRDFPEWRAQERSSRERSACLPRDGMMPEMVDASSGSEITTSAAQASPLESAQVSRPVRVLIVDTAIAFGGTLAVARNLLKHLDRNLIDASLVSACSDGFVSNDFAGDADIRLLAPRVNYVRLQKWKQAIRRRFRWKPLRRGR